MKFYLLPDFGQMKQAGILNVITAAMNQAFFTLSVGMGSMEIFGSYMSKNHTLIGESLRIGVQKAADIFPDGHLLRLFLCRDRAGPLRDPVLPPAARGQRDQRVRREETV